MDPLIMKPQTLGELLQAVEGLRGQLSTFSQQSLAEIDLLKYWIQKAITDGAKLAITEVRK